MVVKLEKKYVSIVTTSCYVFGSKHPFYIFMVFVLIWMHRSFPLLFSLLLYASPVIASTLLLLGTLLFFGQANEPESNDHPKPHCHIDSSAMKGNDKLKHRVRSELRRVQSSENKMNGLKSSRRTSIDSSSNVLGHRRIDDDNKGWETGSDLVESASLGDMFPDLLLDSQVTQMNYAASDHSHESGDTVNETDDYDDDDDQDDIDEEDENVILWTEDDQRNVMNMGTSEFERNRRLEDLIARQKTLRIMAEKNMANVSPDLHFNATHVITGRNNPFDLPHYDSSVNNVGSAAPSVMIPLRHPFDFPYDPSDMKHSRVGPTFPTDDPFLCRRHESFGVGPSTFVGPKQGINLGPYFVPDRSNYSTMNRSDTESIGTEDNPSREPYTSVLSKVKTQGGNARNEWSPSIFCDVTDDINDDDEIDEFKSIENPTEDSEDLQISDDDHPETSHTEGGWLPQRLKSWLTGWKA